MNHRNPKYSIVSLTYIQSFHNYPMQYVPFKEVSICSKTCSKTSPKTPLFKNTAPIELSKLSSDPNKYVIYDVQGRKVNSRYEDLPNYTLYLIYDLEKKKFIKVIKQ